MTLTVGTDEDVKFKQLTVWMQDLSFVSFEA
jgi:hypothetical protein